MAYSFEASIHIPLTIILLCAGIVSLPKLCVEIESLAKKFTLSQLEQEVIYKTYRDDSIYRAFSSPKRLIEVLMWSDSQIVSIKDLTEEIRP